jgi:hypothetical protein
VSVDIEQRRDGLALEPVAVFRFLSEDWSPWIALVELRRRWPELAFRLTPSALEPVVLDGRSRRAQSERPRRAA